eukprot:TRINITY_DN156_c0_g1_i7.p1 TRINITY_DN156_c0_g1~~TRINITY_DN156_c0_g1_i7.p1  ORF type:complete len:218 (+),score=44.20 TRINITY_DN156_c0_g1_i7:42-656(+)
MGCPPGTMIWTSTGNQACFATTMNSNWDLGPNAERNVGRIPVNANEFVASIDANMDAEMRWVDSTSGRVIVGTSDAVLGTNGGIYTDASGQEMVVTYRDDGNTVTITSPQATVSSDVIVQAGPSGAQGTVTLSWNGVSPCETSNMRRSSKFHANNLTIKPTYYVTNVFANRSAIRMALLPLTHSSTVSVTNHITDLTTHSVANK